MKLNSWMYYCVVTTWHKVALHSFKVFCNILGLSHYYKMILHLIYKYESGYTNKVSVVIYYSARLC